MNLSMRIRIARQRAKMSQEALAIAVGVTRGAVANWECSVGTAPTCRRLEHIARTTQVSFEWLATGRGEISLKDENVTLAVDAELVYDATERRLLADFRQADKQLRETVLRVLSQVKPETARKRTQRALP